MTQDELQARCAVWQQRLRLCDWDILVKVRRLHQMESKYDLGTVERFRRKKSAVIYILDAGDKFSEGDMPCDQDPELTLVHELLHIQFADSDPAVDDDCPRYVAHEAAIHNVSRALVNGWRAADAAEKANL